MKSILLVAAAATLMSACAATGPKTAWGKANVSKVDYGTDVGMCTGYAAMTGSGNGSNTAGGINGQNTPASGNSAAHAGRATGSSSAPGTGTTNSGGGSGGAFPTGGGGAYRDSMPTDMVQRAATQQRSQEMAAQRARTVALSRCLTERGYTEIKLTPEQRAHLGTLKEGSNEYHEYLYKLGADPQVLKLQAARK